MLKNPNVKEIKIDLNQGICEVELEYGERLRKRIEGMHEVFNYIGALIYEDQLIINEHTKFSPF